MREIYFHFEDTEPTTLPNYLITWIDLVIKKEEYELNELNYIFCSDDYLLNINQQFLNHDDYTDVITFDHSTEMSQIFGDIYISVDRVAENSSQLDLAFEDELCRVMVHGLLHLCGYADKNIEQKKIMTSKEDAYLSLRTKS